MKNELKSHFKDADIKYIDPSYMIRSTPTISSDRIYCKVGHCSQASCAATGCQYIHKERLAHRICERKGCRKVLLCSLRASDPFCVQVLAHNAVHAAFAGYTGVTVGLVNTHYVYLPIPVIIQAPRKVRWAQQALLLFCLKIPRAESTEARIHSDAALQVDPKGKTWNRLRASIGQPNFVEPHESQDI
jgi:6-phosphofructokinase 1